MLSMDTGSDIPLLSTVMDILSCAGLSADEIRELRAIASFRKPELVAEIVSILLLHVALSGFLGASLSDDSEDSCRRCFIRLDRLLSMSDTSTVPSIDTPPTGFCKLLSFYHFLSKIVISLFQDNCGPVSQ